MVREHIRRYTTKICITLSAEGKTKRSLLDFFGKLTRVMKTLTTGINLYWGLMSNVPSDFTGFKHTPSTNNIFKYTADYLKSIAGIIKLKRRASGAGPK